MEVGLIVSDATNFGSANRVRPPPAAISFAERFSRLRPDMASA
jgi:hypothetical protein